MKPSSDAAAAVRRTPASSAAARAVAAVRRVSSRELLGDTAEIEIEHGVQIYRLRRTSLGKLILTK
jgi:hemin uptake protein HemP